MSTVTAILSTLFFTENWEGQRWPRPPTHILPFGNGNPPSLNWAQEPDTVLSLLYGWRWPCDPAWTTEMGEEVKLLRNSGIARCCAARRLPPAARPGKPRQWEKLLHLAQTPRAERAELSAGRAVHFDI